jgi:predicted enzyme related to lactoylglutathione lyase
LNVDDVDAAARAFEDGGAKVVEPVTTLDRAGSTRALLRDPAGMLLELIRPVADSIGGIDDEPR